MMERPDLGATEMRAFLAAVVNGRDGSRRGQPGLVRG